MSPEQKRPVLGRLRKLAWRALGPAPAPPHAAPTAAPTAAPGAGSNHWVRVALLAEQHVAEAGAVARPNYSWSILHAANIARTLGIERIAALEFGCAGGNGLLALESAAEFAERHIGTGVDVHGFDTGAGLPPPEDLRDAPYLMEQGQFPMDQAALRARLRRTELHLGLVRDTVAGFVAAPVPPVGFVSFDLDYYSSTVDALSLFDAGPERFLPRVLCYFDDTLGYPWGESNGERLAIHEFNRRRTDRVIDRLEGMRWLLPASQTAARWAEALYATHVLDHPRAAEDEGVAFVTRLDLAPEVPDRTT
jgi:hypothetical protein